MRYLGKLYGLYPDGPEAEAHADCLMSFVTDFIAEGRLVFHPKCFTASYYTQIEESKPHIAWFETERMPRFLAYLESVLDYNNSQSSPSSFCIGGKLTYVGMYHFPCVVPRLGA